MSVLVVRDAYVKWNDSGSAQSRRHFETEFNLWLKETKADAWDEGYGDDLTAHVPRTNPYREVSA